MRNHCDNNPIKDRDSAPSGSQGKTASMRFLKRIRQKLGMTKYEMAQYLGMLPPTYYYFEDRAKGCSFEALTRMRERLKMSWEELGAFIDEDHKGTGTEEVIIIRRKK